MELINFNNILSFGIKSTKPENRRMLFNDFKQVADAI